MLKQTLQQKQTQKLSPQHLIAIKLTELTQQELEQRVSKEVEENPMLEETVDDTEGEEESRVVSLSEYSNNDPTPSYKLYVNNQGRDAKPEYNTFSVKESFHQSLEAQLGYLHLDDRRHEIALFIIGMLDSDGYLRRDLDSLVDDISFRLNIETDADEVEDILFKIQDFEPVGVGARDLRECLLLQLAAKEQTEHILLATHILEDCFEEFKKKHYSKIAARLGVSEDELKAANAEILKLNPRPGGQIDDSYSDQAQQVVPDFLVELKDGEPVMSMPRYSIPELRINKRYADILLDAATKSPRESREATLFVKQKLDSAKWFIEAIKQRHHTLESTMNAILDFQHDFFTEGDDTKLKPMVLKNIAEKTGLDISTVSRVVSSKYVQTHFGIFPLKSFFSEGLVSNEGEEVSTREIKTILTDSIGEEDKRKPLTDEELVAVLDKKGYKVARRTVAKYRDQLNIPIARLRKEL
ncbi:MAG: RNA polymerase factor sigma-54 [Bacteroidales bacterium]|nr:RNA polymerase factor sigma-54 [Candidatus Cacconaster scatequi]